MRRIASTGLLTALAAAGAAPAPAATLQVDRPCYLARQPDSAPQGQTVGVTGAGFRPGASVAISLDGRLLGTAPASAIGTIATSFPSPAIRGFRSTRTVGASDGANQASAALRVNKLAADFLPAVGNPRTLRVRFYVYGFGPVLSLLNRPTSQPVYEHVLAPDGARRGTFYVGRTSGPCGMLRTPRRRALPFPPRSGRWTFVFTTQRRYSARALPRAGVGFVVRPSLRTP
jgi:hypothetical protein